MNVNTFKCSFCGLHGTDDPESVLAVDGTLSHLPTTVLYEIPPPGGQSELSRMEHSAHHFQPPYGHSPLYFTALPPCCFGCSFTTKSVLAFGQLFCSESVRTPVVPKCVWCFEEFHSEQRMIIRKWEFNTIEGSNQTVRLHHVMCDSQYLTSLEEPYCSSDLNFPYGKPDMYPVTKSDVDTIVKISRKIGIWPSGIPNGPRLEDLRKRVLGPD